MPAQILETPKSLSLVLKPPSIPLGPLSRYQEAFSKVPGEVTSWKLRRDLVLTGNSQAQCFYTACGTLILRCGCAERLGCSHNPALCMGEHSLQTH